ncbi:MAG: hypothetical protein ACTSQP_00655 [Promethearchaeota archaeon]
MKNKLIMILIVINIFLIISAPVGSVKAQDYSFDVDSEIVNVYIEKDGSITIEYWITFTCHQGAHPIDYADIGFPNKYYDINSVKADVDGNEVKVTGPSPYIDIGVEIYLGQNSIDPGETATLHVKGNNPKMVYEDYEDTSMASVMFSPTWFDSEFCSKFDYLEVNFYFPDGVKDGNEVKYYFEKYSSYSRDNDGNLIFTWKKKDVPMQQYTFGVAFPKKYVDSYEPWTANPQLISIVVGTLTIISIIGIIGGGGYLLYVYHKEYKKRYYPPKPKLTTSGMFATIFFFAFFAGFFFIIFWALFGDIILILGFFLFILIGFGTLGYAVFKALNKTKLPYIKPDMKIDCAGVNKNLTVIEAAIIQNIPLNKVVFLIIFSLIRTGHLKIVSTNPLKFKVVSKKGISRMRAYQRRFLNSIRTSGEKKGTISENALKKILVNLIRATYRKMSGYDLKATIRYYQIKIEKAWEAVKKMPSEVDWKEIEDYYEYLILDDHFTKKSEKYLGNKYYRNRPYYYDNYYLYHYYYPRYYSHYHGGSSTPPKSKINIFTFSDSIVKGIEDLSNSIVSNFSSFADKIINTVAPPQKTSGSGRGYHGGGCACACACAGCACACAGGGR